MYGIMVDQDTQLMLRAQSGEDSAFRELFERHYTRAVNIAYRSLGDRDLAEDIAMEAFARIYEARRSFRASAKFTTYLYRTVINLSINAAKRRGIIKQECLDDSDLASPPSEDPSQHVQRADVARAVRRAVLSLPAGQRMALVLTRYEDMTYADAAEAMGVSVGALESLLHRAKGSLRKSLKNYVEM